MESGSAGTASDSRDVRSKDYGSMPKKRLFSDTFSAASKILLRHNCDSGAAAVSCQMVGLANHTGVKPGSTFLRRLDDDYLQP
jgi:hypothetical protein